MEKENIYPCPNCGAKNWGEGSVGCEDCGDHDAVRCRECNEAFEHVWNEDIYNAVCESYGVTNSWNLPKE